MPIKTFQSNRLNQDHEGVGAIGIYLFIGDLLGFMNYDDISANPHPHPIALKSDKKMLRNNCTYKQDGDRPHTHNLSQKLCADHFSEIIPQDLRPPNSPIYTR